MAGRAQGQHAQVPSWKGELARLRQRATALEEENASLKRDLREGAIVNREVISTNQHVASENKVLKKDVVKLTHERDLLKAAKKSTEQELVATITCLKDQVERLIAVAEPTEPTQVAVDPVEGTQQSRMSDEGAASPDDPGSDMSLVSELSEEGGADPSQEEPPPPFEVASGSCSDSAWSAEDSPEAQPVRRSSSRRRSSISYKEPSVRTKLRQGSVHTTSGISDYKANVVVTRAADPDPDEGADPDPGSGS